MATATLVFTVERTNQTAAALQQALMRAPVPLTLLVSLGLFVSSDTFAAVVLPNGNPGAQRTLVLLTHGVGASFQLQANGNNQVTAVLAGYPLGSYGGIPRLTMNSFLAAIATGGQPAPLFATPQQVPQFEVVAQVNSAIVAQGGSNYSATPEVVFEGATMQGGVQAQGHATVVGGVITAITVTNTGSGYCTPPVIKITDTTGSGAYGMATMSVSGVNVSNPGVGVTPAMAAVSGGSTPTDLFDTIAPSAPAKAAILGSLISPEISSRVRMPVIAAAPVIT